LVRFTEPEIRVLRPRDRDPATGLPITVAQHADAYRIVTEGGRTGPWSTDYVAFAKEPMESWTLPWVRRIILCFPPQSSKTQIALNCVHYSIDQAPGPIMWVACDENKAKDAVSKKIKPMIRASARLLDLLPAAEREITNRNIHFRNGVDLQVVWATSPAQLAQESVRYLVRDEVDKYPEFSGREADPMSLGEQRVISFPYTYKILDCSTPGLASGIITTAMHNDADEIREYLARCPICATEQRMEFEFITWPSDIRDWRTIRRQKLARYSCCSCGMKWDDRTRDIAVRHGRWIAADPCPDGRPATIFYHLAGSWYSPMVSLSDAVAAYLQSREDPAKEMAFVTQHKVIGYSPRVAPVKEADILARHRLPDLPPRTVPAGAFALTCGIDSHKRYYKYVVRAWAPDLTSWLIDYGVLASEDDTELERLVFQTRYPVQGAPPDAPLTMGIWRAAIDSGGGKHANQSTEENITEKVYEFCRKYAWLHRVYPTKGASHKQIKRVNRSTLGTAPNAFYGGKAPKWARFGLLDIHILDTDAFKGLIHQRLEREEGQTERFYLHSKVGSDYVLELLGEELHRDRKGNLFWQQIRANHWLDCEVGAAACADPEWFPPLELRRRIQLAEEAVEDRSAAATTEQRAEARQAERGARW
jgi:phage terminase large subunit GpA-like protein